eukprot:899131-Rhodomonas_salina.1
MTYANGKTAKSSPAGPRIWPVISLAVALGGQVSANAAAEMGEVGSGSDVGQNAMAGGAV